MGVNLNSGLVLYAAGSLMGTLSYLLIMVFQQFMGSSLGRLFFTINYEELMVNACYSGLWALIFMFTPYEKYRNLMISLLPGLTYLASTRGGFNTVLQKFDLSLFTTYETPLVLVVFAALWGLGINKLINNG
ncbi:MAG TPA: hypothetical protein DCL21_00165 [Alphaproteobacteria bacterium]|nr:hypothetical protein [Alphaproteobacteria bacterium]